MASESVSAAQPQGEDIAALKKDLYTACSTSPSAAKGFRQQDLLDFEIIPDDDINLVLQVAQALVNEKLLWIFHDADGIGWNVRSKEDAAKYRSLTTEQEMVYQLIDNAATEGIWSKTIKSKTALHDAVFRACIKHLETKNMISDMKTVEHPTRKMYIKSSIRPSDRATGGSWYTDSELDEEFISMLMDVLYNFIAAKSFYRSSSNSASSRKLKEPKKTKKVTPEEAKALRDKTLSRTEPDSLVAARREYSRLLPMPPGYQSYPSLSELTLFIENSPITSVTLPATDIQQLLDILIFDNRIEQVVAGPEGVAYKAVRKSFRETQLAMEGAEGGCNGLTEAPCGRCPVFELCEEGGPVGPSNCEYFKEWLSL